MISVSNPTLPLEHLSPGQLIVTREPKVIATVLGSCVAVTMFDQESALAAICHAMLAEPPAGGSQPAEEAHRFRYVAHVLPAMIGAFRQAGIRERSIQVKLFGGANVIGASQAPEPHWVGRANVAAVRALLERARLAVTAENTGGRRGRKILFHTGTGEVLHKHLGATPPRG